MTQQAQTQIPVGISSCLMGEEVRYNGGHKQSRYCLQVLQDYFLLKPFCPEMAIGLGVPREPIRLIESDGDIRHARAVGVNNSSMDVTDQLTAYGNKVTRENQALSGYIFMKDSPSCGVFRVKVYRDNGYPSDERRAGIYAQTLIENQPNLPIEEEGRLNDPFLRENFIMRVFTYHEWQNSVAKVTSAKALVDFHSRYKYTIMAHSQPAYKALGQLVATAGIKPLDKLNEQYITQLMDALKTPVKRRSHCNVLQHILGYLKRDLDSPIRNDLLVEIERYRKGEVHLSVPITLMNHYIKHHGNEYIKNQSYLNPHPLELGLRNYI